MNQVLDYRTDLYSLGVTFYQMLTGDLPFHAADPVEWAHCHIARAPTPPHERVPQVPPVVSSIVLKLLAKTAEERYQGARGLQRDLERCLEQLRATGGLESFPLGQHDVPERFRIPRRLSAPA